MYEIPLVIIHYVGNVGAKCYDMTTTDMMPIAEAHGERQVFHPLAESQGKDKSYTEYRSR